MLIYQVRVYQVAGGQAEGMRRRFRGVAANVFPRYGDGLPGGFATLVGLPLG